MVRVLSHNWSQYSNATLEATPAGYKRFNQDVFGVSVHFGLYSAQGKKEWNQCIDKVPREVYAKQIETFNPAGFNAQAWIDEFVSWGATAFMITTKHHDGFCLFESKHTQYTSVNAPLFKRDMIAEIAAACQKRGVALHLYHSLIDWNHPLMSSVDFEPAKDFHAYIDYMEAQITELLTNYGPIAGMLFDGWWPGARATVDQGEVIKEDRWPYGRIFDHIHRLMPACMVTNNHHLLPLAGEDYQVGEIDIPGENTTGFNCTERGNKPLLAWMTMTPTSWSYQPDRADRLTAEQHLAKYKACRAVDAVYFQNIGPRGDGLLEPNEVEIMRRFAALRGPVY